MVPWLFFILGSGLLGLAGLLLIGLSSSKLYIIIGCLCIAVGSSLGTFGWTKITARNPVLDAECIVSDTGDPRVLDCVVKNSGNGEAKDISMSFNKMLPLGTNVTTSSPFGIKLIESKVLPNPILEPTSAPLLPAFLIQIPRIAAKDKAEFKIITNHPTNIKAVEQLRKIHREIDSIFRVFVKRLADDEHVDTSMLDIDAAMRHLTKLENFFMPGEISYESGRHPVLYQNDAEEKAWDDIGNLWDEHGDLRADILKGRPKFEAPRVFLKLQNGEGYYSMLPPYVSSFSYGRISKRQYEELKKKGLGMLLLQQEGVDITPQPIKSSPAKQALIDEHNAVARSYEDKHLYFIPLMAGTNFSDLPKPLQQIFKDKSPKYHQIEGGVVIGLADKIEFLPQQQEWIATRKGYFVHVNPEFRKWQKNFRKRLREIYKPKQ